MLDPTQQSGDVGAVDAAACVGKRVWRGTATQPGAPSVLGVRVVEHAVGVGGHDHPHLQRRALLATPGALDQFNGLKQGEEEGPKNMVQGV